jgi:hypothetical protein
LRHILSHGGAGYFPERVVAPEVANATLFPVRNAPTFVRPAHVIYPGESENEVRASALASLRQAAAADGTP